MSFLYIDGTNLFAGQNELFGLNKYLSFNYLIREIKKIFKVDHIYFYASYKGHRSPTSGKEKGVDVHLAVDIVKDVFLGNCKEVVIMTGDADFIYPIEIAKQFKIKTGAVFLPNRFSLEMAYKVNKAYVFDFLGKFKINRKLPSQLKIIKKSPVCKHTG